MLTRKIFTIISLFPSVLLAQNSINQDTNIQEVIIQENRLQIPFSQSSRNVQILSKEDFQKLPGSSLNEKLRYVSGVDIRQRGPFGTQADIGIDGGSFDQVLVLLNGIKLSDPQTGHHMLNIPIPMEAIERIEILRGPASSIYGINGLTGAINIVTKQITNSNAYAHVYGGSSFKDVEEEGEKGKYYAGGFQVGGAFYSEKHQHQLYLTKEKGNGQRYNTAADNERIYYQNQLVINDRNHLNMLGGYINNRFGANGYYAAPGDKESEELVESTIASISSSHQLSEKWFFSPRISHRYNEDDYRYFRHDLSKARSQHYTHTLSSELNASYKTNYGSLGLGLEGRYERISSSNIGEHSRKNYGAFTEFRSTYIKNFIVNVGLYMNYNSDYNWQFFPGIDLSYLINSNWRISASSGTSQRIPTFTDLYLNQRPGNIGNPDLKSENSWQNDFSIDYRSGNLTTKAGYFFRDIDNFIDWIRESNDVPYQATNLGNNKTHGLYGNVNYTLPLSEQQGLQFQASYTYLDPSIINKYPNTVLKYGIESLKHQAILGISYRYKGWSIHSANRLLDRQLGKQYFITDARFAYQHRLLQLYIDIQNISDTKYIEIGAVPMPGRWASLGIKYTWNKD